MNNELMVASEHIEILEPEIVSDDKVFVAGRNWSSMDVRRGLSVEGHTIKEILLEALRREFRKTPTELQENLWLSRCRCKVNGVEVKADKWDSYVPKAGEFVEFLVAPKGGGGGGKNPLAMVLMLAVAVFAFYVVGPFVASQMSYMMGAEFAGTTIYGATATSFVSMGAATASVGAQAIAGVAALATMSIGTYAVSKICPTTMSPQQAASSQGTQSSPTYSINGSSNSANPYGFVPLILGRFRQAGPLGAKSWTKQIGDDQYFNMLVIWGHADVVVKDFRIGETSLKEYKDVDHVFHQATTGNDLKYFNKSYNEQSVGADLLYNQPVVREIGECESISVDISFVSLTDATDGEKTSAEVQFHIQYAPVGTENWSYFKQKRKFFAPAQECSSSPRGGRENLYCSSDGVWHADTRPPDSDEEDPRVLAGMIPVTDPNWTPRYPFIYEKYTDKHKKHTYRTKDAWYEEKGSSNVISIAAESSSPITRSFEWAVPRGKYKVKITRITKDTNSDTVFDDAKWSTVRGIIHQPAFNTPLPVCCSELRIRATEQLSGYVSDFNALCTSCFPIYDKKDANGNEIKSYYGWDKHANANGDIIDNGVIGTDETPDYIYGETVNPADHIRYLLTSQHAIVNPYSESKIDENSLAKFAAYCIKQDYQFSLVCDSEAAVWNRLTAVASAGRGAITTDNDGLFGVMVDNAEKTVTQMFTPRNSWGFSIERAFYTLPHALRVTYYDAEDNYKQKEGFVYADGYNRSNATDIVEWSMTGKTRWQDNYRMARYYLASTKLRPVTITLSTDWEWMMCRRGDVVGVSHDVLMNTFGTARVNALIYGDELGNPAYYVTREEDMPSTDEALPIGVRLDDTVIFSEDNVKYGIAIRSNTGTVLTYQVNSVYNTETADMIFTNPITAAQCPYIGALVSVATLDNETSKYLVASINISDNNSAELTLVPWAMPEILEAESGDIPAWEPPIYITSIGGKGALPAPSIREVKSDESMLKRTGNGLTVCMGVWWNLPSRIDSSHGRIYVQGKITPIGKEEESVVSNMVDPTTTNYLEFSNVIEGEIYEIKLRLVGEKSDSVSAWSAVYKHKIVGRTTKPKAPEKVNVRPNPPAGLRISWSAVEVADFDHYHVVITGEGLSLDIKTSDLFTVSAIREWVGELTVKVYSVDVLGLESEVPAIATYTIEKPAVPIIEASSLPGAFELVWQDCSTTWPIDHYEVTDKLEGNNIPFNVSNERTSISVRKANASYAFNITSVDIFGNRSVLVEDTSIYVPGLGVTNPTISLEGTQLVISWDTVASPFGIDYYEVLDVSKKSIGKVKGTSFSILVPEKTSATDPSAERTFTYYVQAVDIRGNKSSIDGADGAQNGMATITVAPPDAPIVSVVKEGDHLLVTWNLPETSAPRVPVVGYEIVRQWVEENEDGVNVTKTENYGRHDALCLSVPAVLAGDHTFRVRSIDNSGNTSSWGNRDLRVNAPGGITFFNCNTVDNTVMLYYTDPDYVYFPIKEYIVSEIVGKEESIPAEIGRTDTHFFADIKNVAGDYTYVITPVDIAGNRGKEKRITMTVAQPPDYVMYIDKYSLFNGTRTNMDLDGRGHMYGPVPSGETWEANIARSAKALGKKESDLRWQDKVEGGMNSYASPAIEQEGRYVEIVDVNDFVPATKINVTVTSEVLDGNPQMTCKIEVSANGEDDWRVATEDGLSVYENNFRYMRFTFTWTGGLVFISEINYKLDVKRKTDFGRVEVSADDNGEGWKGENDPDTAMLTGKWVNFNVDFIDVQSIAKPNIVNDLGNSGLTAYVVFEDEIRPKGFRIFVKDKDGNRASATVDWSAFGV